ncbi:MAG: hypothetical protein WD875_01760 [Pirellulales bacterium]
MLRTKLIATASIAVAAVGLLAVSANSQPQPKEKVGDFMQLKLQHAQAVLDGLVREDFEKIDKHAQLISLLTHDEAWQVIQTPEYRRRSDEFRRAADNIAKAAQKKNLDGATLAYVEMTLNCVSCHRAVRDK